MSTPEGNQNHMAGKTFKRRRGTLSIPNNTVHDRRLSYTALGLLAVLLARPDTAPQGYRDLMGRGAGRNATLAALRELNEAGYRFQIKAAGERGRIVTHTVISEEPISEEEAAEWLRNVALRAPETRARIDQRKHSVSAGGAVLPSTGARSAGARPAGAYISKEISKVTSLRSVTQGDPNVRTHEEHTEELRSMPEWFATQLRERNDQ